MLSTLLSVLFCICSLPTAHGFLKNEVIPSDATNVLHENSNDGSILEEKLTSNTEDKNSVRHAEKPAEHIELPVWPKQPGGAPDGIAESTFVEERNLEARDGEDCALSKAKFDVALPKDEVLSKEEIPAPSVDVLPVPASNTSSKVSSDVSSQDSVEEDIDGLDHHNGTNTSEVRTLEVQVVKEAQAEDVEKLPDKIVYSKASAHVDLEPSTNAPPPKSDSNVVVENGNKAAQVAKMKWSKMNSSDSDNRHPKQKDGSTHLYEHSEEVSDDAKHVLVEVEKGIEHIVLKPNVEPQEVKVEKSEQNPANQLPLLLETTKRPPAVGTEVEESFWESLSKSARCLFHNEKLGLPSRPPRLLDHGTIPMRLRRKHGNHQPGQ